MVCFVFRNIFIFFMMIHPSFALGVKEAVIDEPPAKNLCPGGAARVQRNLWCLRMTQIYRTSAGHLSCAIQQK